MITNTVEWIYIDEIAFKYELDLKMSEGTIRYQARVWRNDSYLGPFEGSKLIGDLNDRDYPLLSEIRAVKGEVLETIRRQRGTLW